MAAELNPRELAFLMLYSESGNAAESYCRAWGHDVALAHRFGKSAAMLMRRPLVKAKIDAIEVQAIEQATISRSDVLREIESIALAYGDELTQLQTVGCRFCYGIGFRFQWMHDDEFALALAVHHDSMSRITTKKAQKLAAMDEPDDYGGYGYDPKREPNVRCPKCLGRGHVEVTYTSTNKMTPAARRLFKGVKQTKHGFEVITRDQDAMLVLLAKSHKLIDNNPTDLPPPPVPSMLPDDPLKAAKTYQDFIKS